MALDQLDAARQVPRFDIDMKMAHSRNFPSPFVLVCANSKVD